MDLHDPDTQQPAAGMGADLPGTAGTGVRPSRPLSVTLLVVGVLIFTGMNLFRLGLALGHWGFLAGWSGVSPAYITLTGLIWSLAGLRLGWGLWRARAWAPRWLQAVALTYAVYYWMDHIFLMDHPLGESAGGARYLLPVNWPFAAGVTVVCLAFISWILTRRSIIAYFGESYE